MKNMGEDYVREALGHIGLPFVARNHLMHRPDGSIEGEVDLVCTFKGCTFVMEVSASRQRDARRIKRKKLREWHAGDPFARLSSALGLPASNRLCAVYVDLSRPAKGGGEPGDFNGGIAMGDEHIKKLLSESPGRGLSAFLSWNGIPRDPGAP